MGAERIARESTNIDHARISWITDGILERVHQAEGWKSCLHAVDDDFSASGANLPQFVNTPCGPCWLPQSPRKSLFFC